jgi:hypothetical protein
MTFIEQDELGTAYSHSPYERMQPDSYENARIVSHGALAIRMGLKSLLA